MPADPYPVPPFTVPVSGQVSLPGSKSITNRALILAALSSGTTTVRNALFSDDTRIMTEALRRLGFSVETDEAGATIEVEGLGGEIPAREAELFVGNAGTAARFLTALCCLSPHGRFRLDGVPQMRKRPIRGLLDAASDLGARITSNNGFFPITIAADGLRGGHVSLDATESSQLLSALLMVAPYAASPLSISLRSGSIRRAYVEMTLRMMTQFGQPETPWDEGATILHPPHGQAYEQTEETYIVEPDASAASYFLALPATVGGEITVLGLTRSSLQGDVGFDDCLAAAGCSVSETQDGLRCSRPLDTALHGISRDFYPISDTFLTQAAIAPRLSGKTFIDGIAHTRKQECDRVAAMATELKRLGQQVVESEAALEITPQPLKPAVIETYHDHRVAMSFGVLGCYNLLGDGSPWLEIRDPACCAKTFPRFFEVLEEVRQRSLESNK